MGLLTVSGSLTIRERIAISDAVATVKVVDTQGEVLAATALAVESVPFSFEVAIDEELVDGRLLVWAFLRTSAGAWGTVELAPADRDEIVLTRIEE